MQHVNVLYVLVYNWATQLYKSDATVELVLGLPQGALISFKGRVLAWASCKEIKCNMFDASFAAACHESFRGFTHNCPNK